jgi:hypothetical protein
LNYWIRTLAIRLGSKLSSMTETIVVASGFKGPWLKCSKPLHILYRTGSGRAKRTFSAL